MNHRTTSQEASASGQQNADDVHPILKHADELHELGFNAGWNAAVEECAKIADAAALANKKAANSIFESGGQKSAICFMDAARACEALSVKIRALTGAI